jgi:osmotically-inducible protein OsmY
MHEQTTFKYLEAHIREALAEDDRCNMLDVQIRVADQRVFLIGVVESEHRRAAAEEVVRERLPGSMEVVNQLCIGKYEPPTEAEYVG